jgi:hypothetical protein
MNDFVIIVLLFVYIKGVRLGRASRPSASSHGL